MSGPSNPATTTGQPPKEESKSAAGVTTKDIWGDDEASQLDSQIASMDVNQLNTRVKMFENNIRIMKSESNRSGNPLNWLLLISLHSD